MILEVASKQKRLERRNHHWSWSSIAVLGVIGWSVTVPTLAGVALGIWIDQRWPSRFSWSLMLMVTGLVLGCIHAWLRVKDDQL
jgi:ATP synthase protein I